MNPSDTLRALYAEQPFLLAPLAGVTDAPYRLMCRAHGARLAYSEMVSVAGLAYASEKTWDLVLPDQREPQICVQLFGSKPEQFAQAVEAVQERVGDKLTLIDINMACPVRKVAGKGEGCALMRTPELAADIVAAAVGRARVPVTVKMRIGYAAGDRNAPEFAARMEDAGAAAVAVHGRTAGQMYRGQADWFIIDEVAARVSVPVIGSGDVFCAADAVAMLTQTAASAVFCARGTYGNPWIFEDALALLNGRPVPEHGFRDRLAAFRRHLELLEEAGAHLVRARTFAAWYLKGLPEAASWRRRAAGCSTEADWGALLADLDAAAAHWTVENGKVVAQDA